MQQLTIMFYVNFAFFKVKMHNSTLITAVFILDTEVILANAMTSCDMIAQPIFSAVLTIHKQLITLSEDQNGILDICRFDCLSYRIIAIFNIDAFGVMDSI